MAVANIADCGTPKRVSVPSVAAPTAVGTVPWWASWKPTFTREARQKRPAITATIAPPCLVLPTIRPNVRGRLNGITSSRKISNQFVQRRRVLERVRGVRVVEAAAVGAELLDGLLAGDRAAGDALLGPGQRVIVCTSWKFWIAPPATSTMAATTAIGSRMRRQVRTRST